MFRWCFTSWLNCCLFSYFSSFSSFVHVHELIFSRQPRLCEVITHREVIFICCLVFTNSFWQTFLPCIPVSLFINAISLGFWRTREIVASLPHKFLFKPLLQRCCTLEVFTEGRLPELHNEFKFKLDRSVEMRRDASCRAVIGKDGDPAWQGLGISTWLTLSSEQQKLTQKEQTHY